MSSNMMRILANIGLFLAIIITVTEAKVRIQPDPNGKVGVMSGESKFFQCVGDNKNEKLAWIGPQGQDIESDPNNGIYTHFNPRKNTIKLEINKPTKRDSGIYKCVARNERNEETSSAFFKLHVFNPTIVSGKTSYQVNEGHPVRMECIVNADKDVNVEFMWRFGQTDLSQDQRQYRIDVARERAGNPEEIRYVSRLEIRNVSKEHDGNYICDVDTTNEFISDSKELKVTLRVQYKPRFDEKTPQYIWVSEEAAQQGGPIAVNISCIVYADPVATIKWFTFDNRPVNQKHEINGVKTKIDDSTNMSTMMVTFPNIDIIRDPRAHAQVKYQCRAENTQGGDQRMFEIKIGRIPDSPIVVNLDYKDGAIILELNETNVEPPVDIYRLEIADEQQAHLFNKSNAKNNTTYVIETALPRGEHKVDIYAHNPVGWSEQPYSSYFLQVVSAGHRPHLSLLNITPSSSSMFSTTILILLLVIVSFLMQSSQSSFISLAP